MSALTQEQIDALNNFARTHPHLAKVFGYTSSDSNEGLGTALNDDGSSINFNLNQFYLTQDSSGNTVVNITNEGGGGGVSDHGALSGLLDDDHPQYILADGTRDFTGDQSMGGNQLTDLGAPVNPSDAARLQDIGPGFYGIIVKDDDTIVTADSIKFRSRDFDVNVEGDGASITLAPEIKAAGFYLNPGIYGVGRSLNEDVISFDISTLSVDLYFFESFVDQGFIIDDLHIISSSGSAVVGFYILENGQTGDGARIPGLDPVSVSSAKIITAPTANNVVNPGDSLLMGVKSNTAARHVRGRLKIKLAG